MNLTITQEDIFEFGKDKKIIVSQSYDNFWYVTHFTFTRHKQNCRDQMSKTLKTVAGHECK